MMKADLRAELDLLSMNVDEMIRLCECATDAGVWPAQQAARYTAHLDSLRGKLNADLRELITLREHADQALEHGERITTYLNHLAQSVREQITETIVGGHSFCCESMPREFE